MKFYWSLIATFFSRTPDPYCYHVRRRLFRWRNILRSLAVLIFGTIALFIALVALNVGVVRAIVMPMLSTSYLQHGSISYVIVSLVSLTIYVVSLGLFLAGICTLCGIIVYDFRTEKRNNTFESLVLTAVNPGRMLFGYFSANAGFFTFLCLVLVLLGYVALDVLGLYGAVGTTPGEETKGDAVLTVLYMLVMLSALTSYLASLFLRFSLRFDDRRKMLGAVFRRLMVLVFSALILPLVIMGLTKYYPHRYPLIYDTLIPLGFLSVLFLLLPLSFRALEREFMRFPRKSVL